MKPQRLLTLDFETRSEEEIKKVGAWAYAAHASTKIICAAYAYNDTPHKIKLYIPEEFELHRLELSEKWKKKNPEDLQLEIQSKDVIVVDKQEFFQDLNAALADGATLSAHNIGFERSIFKYCLPEIHIPVDKWFDTAAACATHALPRSLEKALIALKSNVSKDMEGNKNMRAICSPIKKWLKLGKVVWDNSREKFRSTFDYCAQDIRSQIELANKVARLSPTEQTVCTVCQKVNERGVAVDVESVEAILALFNKEKETLEAEFQRVTNGEVFSASATTAFLGWLKSKGAELKNLQKATVSAALRRKEISNDARRALELRKLLSQTSSSKYMRMNRPRLQGLFMYHGATTGRWTGKLVQPHNLPRKTYPDMDGALETIKTGDLQWFRSLYGSISNIAPQLIRGMFVAGKGKDLVCSDYSGVEARGLSWLVKDEKLLHAFRTNRDVYKLAATDIYSADKLKYSDVTKDQRMLGKVAVLSLGYGSGWSKFRETAGKFGVELSEERAQEVVAKWRESNPLITSFWYACDNAAKTAVFHKGKVFKVGKVAFLVKSGYLQCRLPSGRRLYYPYPAIEKVMKPWGKEGDAVTFYGKQEGKVSWGRSSTYGGKLVENITQAMCRDVLAMALVRLENSKKYSPVFHVHDEIVSEVDEGLGDLEEYNKIMTYSLPWCADLPLAAEGWIGKRYRK